MKSYNKIFIVAPYGLVTGGAELLHQLGKELKLLGRNVFMAYTPLDGPQICPDQYLHYGVESKEIEDGSDCLIVIPEISTTLTRLYKNAHFIVWWLSVDNYRYQGRRNLSWLKIKSVETLRMLCGRFLPVFLLKRHTHLCQSFYAKNYLAKRGINATMLSDYISDEHFETSSDIKRNRQIAYNPKKGALITNQLIESNPDIKFTPIQGLSPSGVRDLLLSSMIYIDFGQHPGKDRFPREAAAAGCCVITGTSGSAAYQSDVNIPLKYKIDESDRNLKTKFRNLVEKIFDDFESLQGDFSEYRGVIRSEKEIFQHQVRKIFN